jgi:hypothetical protein
LEVSTSRSLRRTERGGNFQAGQSKTCRTYIKPDPIQRENVRFSEHFYASNQFRNG